MGKIKISDFGATSWEQSMPFVQTFSWMITDKLIGSCDEVSLFWSNTPDGPGYDTVQAKIVHEGHKCEVWMNRGGSIHLEGAGGGGPPTRST